MIYVVDARYQLARTLEIRTESVGIAPDVEAAEGIAARDLNDRLARMGARIVGHVCHDIYRVPARGSQERTLVRAYGSGYLCFREGDVLPVTAPVPPRAPKPVVRNADGGGGW